MLSPTRSLVNDAKVDMISTKNNDMKQRRVVNAAPAVDSNDYVVKSQVDQTTAILQSNLDNINNKMSTTSFLKTSPLTLGTVGGLIGFFGATPVTLQVLNSYTSDPQSVAYSGLSTGAGGAPYAQVNDLNNLRFAVENLRQMCEDLRTKLQTSTIVG